MSASRVSVCIATYRRQPRLDALLADLALQQRLPDQVVVVDNDAAASAREVTERHRRRAPFELVYAVQPEKNISLTRNRTVELATGDWLAFVDDDERAPAAWLSQLLACAARYRADGVLGPVEPLLPSEAPRWIRRGRFYDWARMASGTRVPPNRLRFGNVLLRADLLQATTPVFDPAYGLTGGEDGDLLSRLTLAGANIVWCDEAIVSEPVEGSRLSLRWLLRRSLRGGQDFARHTVSGRYGPVTLAVRTRLLLRALLQAFTAAALALLLLPLGRHHAARWLTKASANLGKLSIFCGWHYREYA
ncbi:MAG: glycosyl transferase [Hydrocarboniphaga sp.]|uniref:glycosyltransferase family 2 protein n=1 Tax=Hydrocarboniphaga sp. TaxID=2033016 RepID=UPI00261AFF1E|nr:glycosyltransferase family 2 protein [Hydrocarboniphaga sp.]MDB5969094.1 glycosyl transferase [Hydrocarboniphaga sp.]